LGREVLINFIQREKSFRIIPSSDVDSLLASATLLKNLSQHGYDVKVSFDLKRIIDEPGEPTLLVNLKPVNPSTQAVLEPARDSSVTGTVVSVLDEYFGVDKWDKILAVVATSALTSGIRSSPWWQVFTKGLTRGERVSKGLRRTF